MDALQLADGMEEVRLDEVRLDEVRLDQVRLDQVRLDEVRLDEVRLDQVRLDQVRVDEVRLDEVRVDNASRRAVAVSVPPDAADVSETAVRKRTAVSLYVVVAAVVAAGCAVAAVLHDPAPLALDVIAFLILASLSELREIRMPLVGIVTLSFVPVLASLIVFGLWPALLVAAASGLTTAWFTRDPMKIVFNVSDYVVSTFAAGLLYLALAPAGGSFMTKVIPTFAATVVDFAVNTVLLAGVIALASHENAIKVWRQNYEWGLPSYLTGSTLALLLAGLYFWLGLPGILLSIPPLYLIYYSYDTVSYTHLTLPTKRIV